MFKAMKNAVSSAGDVCRHALVTTCTFENDTKHDVVVVLFDGTHTLYPGDSLSNFIFKGFSVKLIMKLSRGVESRIDFPSSQFDNRTHKMSTLFKNEVVKMEARNQMMKMKVLEAISEWRFIYNHPGAYEEEVTVQMKSKHSWKKQLEEEDEAEAGVKSMIKAVELSASFKAKTKVTRLDEYEREISESRKRTFKELCYLWQEIVVIKTNQPPPFDILEIPTPHTEMTSTPDKPGKNKAICTY